VPLVYEVTSQTRVLSLIAFTFAFASFGVVGFVIVPAIVGFALVMWTMCKDIHRSGKGSAERRTGRSAITASCSFPSSFPRLYSFDL
jgi:hypothetical protein